MNYRAEIQEQFSEYSSFEQTNSIGAVYQSFGSNNKKDNRGFRIGKDRRYSSNYAIANQGKLLYFSQLLVKEPVVLAGRKAVISRNTALGFAAVINKEARKRQLTETYLSIAITVKSDEDEKLLERIKLNRFGAAGIYCPHCMTQNPYRCSFGYHYRCSNSECHKNIYPLVGTIYENSKIPLSKWLIIEQVFAKDNKFNQSQLARDLSVTQATMNKIVKKLRDPSYDSRFSLLMMKCIIFDKI